MQSFNPREQKKFFKRPDGAPSPEHSAEKSIKAAEKSIKHLDLIPLNGYFMA